MKIWEMMSQDTTAYAVPVMDSEVIEQLIERNLPLNDSWTPLELMKSTTYESDKLTDVVRFVVKLDFLLSTRAADAVRDLIDADAELLPVTVEGQEYWFMHVTSVLDCVDYERSEYRMLPSGKITSFWGIWFKENVVRGHNVFKIKDKPFGNPYVSTAFMERIAELDDHGVRFVLIWDSDLDETIIMNPFH